MEDLCKARPKARGRVPENNKTPTPPNVFYAKLYEGFGSKNDCLIPSVRNVYKDKLPKRVRSAEVKERIWDVRIPADQKCRRYGDER